MFDIEIIDFDTVSVSDPEVEDDGLIPTDVENVFRCNVMMDLADVIGRLSKFIPVNSVDPRVLTYLKNRPQLDTQEVVIPDTAMPHQVEGIHTCVENHGGRSILGLEMGTGKTLMGVIIAAHYGGSILFICPAGKKPDWKKENKQWMGVDTVDCEHATDDVSTETRPVIVSFDVAAKNHSILTRKWTTIVMDECQKIKNDCVRSMNIMPVLQSAEHVLMLTGTPQQSKPLELFNLLTAILPKVFPSKIQFMNRYCDGKLNAWGEWEANGCFHSKELFFILQQVMIRYRTEDVIKDLPPLTRVIVRIDSDDAEFAANMIEMKAKFSRLCAEASSETDPQKKRKKSKECQQQSLVMWRESGLHKVTICMPIILADMAAHPEDKYIIWCEHMVQVKYISDKLVDLYPYVAVTGETPPAKRTSMLEGVSNPDGPLRVAVLSIKSCGEGLNLVPGVSRMWFVETDHTPSLMLQAEKRAHRKGCVKPVFSNWVVLNDSHDDHVLAGLKGKQYKNDIVVDGIKSAKNFFSQNENF
jgi:SWI/SNF-related matrix-associated actin-dependent regulator of chromatin subfamily A-like protein 1